jgi:HEAT repeat protein
VRVALLTDAEEPRIPALNTETAAFWLEEMDGVFRVQARERLEEMGEPAFLFLARRWDALSEENREWLLEWGGEHWPERIEALLTKALDSNSDRVALAALGCIAARGEGGAARFGVALARFIHHPDVALRLAAIRAGAMGVDWRAVLARETEPEVRQACVHGLAREKGSRAVPTLVSLLQEGSWELRAAAVSALTRIGAAAIEAVQPLIHHPRQEVQAGAAQILLALGQESWLYEEMSL